MSHCVCTRVDACWDRHLFSCMRVGVGVNVGMGVGVGVAWLDIFVASQSKWGGDPPPVQAAVFSSHRPPHLQFYFFPNKGPANGNVFFASSYAKKNSFFLHNWLLLEYVCFFAVSIYPESTPVAP